MYHGHPLPFLLALTLRALDAYLVFACRTHDARRLPFFLWQARSARASFCARVNPLERMVGLGPVDVTLPAPENVALDGEPNIAGCGVGAALHASPVSHAGGSTGGGA